VTKWPVGMIVPLQDPTPFSPFRPDEWQQALDVVAASGFDGVELAITNNCISNYLGLRPDDG
jgi:sugar phosphate isomerase/epimerase